MLDTDPDRHLAIAAACSTTTLLTDLNSCLTHDLYNHSNSSFMSLTIFYLASLLSLHALLSRSATASPIRREPRQEAAQSCPNGGTWTRIVESFDGLNQTMWSLEGASGASFGRQGAIMTVTQAQVKRLLGTSYSCQLTIAALCIEIRRDAVAGQVRPEPPFHRVSWLTSRAGGLLHSAWR